MEETSLADQGSFEEDAAAILGRLSGVLTELFGGLATNVSRASDPRQTLKLDNKLCRKMIQVATPTIRWLAAFTRPVQPLGLGYVGSFLSANHDVRFLLPDTRAYVGDDPWSELRRRCSSRPRHCGKISPPPRRWPAPIGRP